MSKWLVYLSPQAESKLDDLLFYLETEWSEKSKQKFIEKLKKKLSQISLQPRSCPESKEKTRVFKAVIEKHVSLYYRILGDEIEVITVFDNRQNPGSLDKEI